MDNRTNLHVKRLRDGFNQIQEFRQGNETSESTNFKTWRQRITQSLKTLFGEDHDYFRRFIALHFCDLRVSLMAAPTWSAGDQQRYEHDLNLAESLLTDALEELDIDPTVIERPSPEPARPETTPQIVVNVNNVLSHTTEVQLSQIINSLDDLDLTADKRAEVEKLAGELEAEAKGEKRWPILAKSLDALKGMGKAVYEQVAIPLLLAMLKKEAGL